MQQIQNKLKLVLVGMLAEQITKDRLGKESVDRLQTQNEK